MRTFYVYIVASRSRRLYVGCTSNPLRRIVEHRARVYRGHTARYCIDRLVYYEVTGDARAAVERERQLKGWTRRRKMELIETVNAGWLDLAADWGLDEAMPSPRDASWILRCAQDDSVV